MWQFLIPFFSPTNHIFLSSIPRVWMYWFGKKKISTPLNSPIIFQCRLPSSWELSVHKWGWINHGLGKQNILCAKLFAISKFTPPAYYYAPKNMCHIPWNMRNQLGGPIKIVETNFSSTDVNLKNNFFWTVLFLHIWCYDSLRWQNRQERVAQIYVGETSILLRRGCGGSDVLLVVFKWPPTSASFPHFEWGIPKILFF